MPTYDLGDGVNLRHLVYNRDGALTDTTVTLLITKPNGATTGPTVSRTSLGQYDAATYVPDLVGTYTYKWTATGVVTDVATGSFIVSDPGPADYTTLPLVKAQLGKITSDDRDEMIQAAITAASRMIDVGRWPGAFRAATTASTRVFPLAGRNYNLFGQRAAILVDDIATITGMTISVGTEASAVYSSVPIFTTGPQNAIARGEPITTVVVPSSSLGTVDTLQVTAKWGWPATPADVELAARLQAARLYRRKDSPQGVIASPEFGGIRVSRFDPDVRALLAPYMPLGFA
jgi:hypothetical protein